MGRDLAISLCVLLSSVAAVSPSIAEKNPLKSRSPICAVLSAVAINHSYPDQALRNLSDAIEPLLDDSLKAHIEPHDPSSPAEPLMFDIDNSGSLKKVLVVSASSHMGSSDTYLAYDDEAWKVATAISFKGAVDGQHATVVFPGIWENCKAWDVEQRAQRLPNQPVRDCPPPDAELPFTTVGTHGVQLHWRARYLHLVPFRYQSATYFLATTEDEDRSSNAFVIKPMPLGQYELTCKLDTGTPTDWNPMRRRPSRK